MQQMKDSGIKWIGQIPDCWEMIPNRYLFVDHSSKVGEQSNKYQLLSLTTAGVKEKDINTSGGKVPESYDNYQIVEPGDMVFCLFDLDCSAVFSGLSNHYGMITSAYDVLKPNHVYLDNLYADFWFQYVFSNRYYKIYSKNIRYTITADMFKSIPMPIPSLEEQRKIGRFLLEKQGKISSLIANQQAQIEKLKEYKQSIITEAVTKGLNPNAPMKDSGVEWIGKIPEHWAICRIKDLFELRNERNYEDLSKVNLLSLYTDLGVVQHSDIVETTGNRAVNADGYKLVYKDDIVVNIILCWMGAIGKSNYNGVTSPAYDVYKPKEKIYSSYYHYLFRTNRFNGECYRYGRGIMMMRWRTYSSEFTAINIPYPSVQEQNKIIDYLVDKCTKIERLISIKQQKIEKLQEYKKSLIYEYVTGKKEVS